VLLICCAAILVLIALYPAPLSAKLFAAAYGIDPQRPSHTFAPGGVQMPLEARKLGMFGGFLLAYLCMLAAGRWRAAAFPPARILAVLIGFVAAMGLDGLNALCFDLGWPHLYTPDLRLRLATGLLTGVAMAAILLPAFNGSLWRDIDDVPSLANGRELLAILVPQVMFFALVDVQAGILYYPLSVFGIAGLLFELLLINMILALALSGRAGGAATAWDVLPIAVAAAVMSAGELTIMSAIRFLALGDMTRFM
jgi:hypothetical protein